MKLTDRYFVKYNVEEKKKDNLYKSTYMQYDSIYMMLKYIQTLMFYLY